MLVSKGKNNRVGVLGGGQLGQMMAAAAHRIGLHISVLDPTEGAPATQSAHRSVKGALNCEESIRELAVGCDVLTVEIEHVDATVLKKIRDSSDVRVEPSPETITTIQDKWLQKVHLTEHNVAVADYMKTDTEDMAREAGQKFGYPFMLKSRFAAYDGKGNAVVKSENDISEAWKKLGGDRLYAEKWVNYSKELAVMVVRPIGQAESAVYPVVETEQKDNICHTVVAPAQISHEALQQARSVALDAINCLSGAGIYGVEMFLFKDEGGVERVIVNEIAPRPHNSGHYTMDGCVTDQFENHLRAIFGLPLGDTSLKTPVAGMVNLLGEEDGDEGMAHLENSVRLAATTPGAAVHWYEKADCRSGRKMGHINFVANSMGHLMTQMRKFADFPLEPTPLVGVIMGSDSDLPKMKAACDILEQFDVPYEVTIVSAHRTPARMYEYCEKADSRGIRVIIAGAGGAAHLPGMVAAMSPLPVIGVPVKSSALNGNDSLLSIVQMPRGVPVATVAIDNSMNAGLLAVRILGSRDETLIAKMRAYQKEMERVVEEKAAKLENIGAAKYLDGM